MSKYQGPFIPLKEELTDRMIGPLLAIIRELAPFLLEPTREPGSVPTSDKLDGGVESAAAATFLRVCVRLDSLVDDGSRWTLKSHNTLVAELIKTQKAQQKFIEVQQQSSEMLQLPHYLLRPTLAVSGGRYVAWWGNINIAGEAVVGQGDTPNDALADFDDAFDRVPSEQVFLIAEKQGLDIKPNEKQTPPKN